MIGLPTATQAMMKDEGIGKAGVLLTNNRPANSLQRSVWRTTLTRSVRSTLKNATPIDLPGKTNYLAGA